MRQRTLVMLVVCGALLASGIAPAGGAQVTFGNLIVRANGGFTPHQLPRRHYAPISFHGRLQIKTTDGSMPPPVDLIRIDFDRDGLLTTAGLPVCDAAQLERTTTKQALSRCAGAQVGRGLVRATAVLPEGRATGSAPLLLFNGPRRGGSSTVLAHAYTTVPSRETYVVEIPVERRGGGFSYRATIDVPPIVNDTGALIGATARIGRHYRAAGEKRSFVSARCSDGIFRTHGLASFTNGYVVSGSLFHACISVD